MFLKHKNKYALTKLHLCGFFYVCSLFGIVVVVVFQSVFYLEMHWNI